MNSKLPKVFKNNIEKEFRNNETFSYGTNKKNEPLKEDINKKINNIFTSPNYIYKANVKITLNNDRIVSKKIIGRNKKQIITLDNELINIEDIKDIEYDI